MESSLEGIMTSLYPHEGSSLFTFLPSKPPLSRVH